MAAAVTSAWSKKPGAWALDAEEHEAAELKTESKGGDTGEFPSLTAAVTTKAKKKKPQAMSLSEFATKPSTKTLTRDEIVSLPTGPRHRTAEELADSSNGRGFRSYSTNHDEPRKREVREPMGPSRADEVDDWGSMKRPVERRERGFFAGSESKADESDNWGSSKREGREKGGERGFFAGSESKADESEYWGSNKSFAPPRRVGFGLSGEADTESWGKKKEEEGGRRFGGSFDSLRERRGGFENDSDSWGKKREDLGVGSERSERIDRPRLKLQPRTVPLSEQNETVPKPKGSNPFGEARPREEVLKEKGKDWKEIDEKLELMKVKDAEVALVRRGFGGGGAATEERGERSWRKPDSVDTRPQSADKVENGVAKEAQDFQE